MAREAKTNKILVLGVDGMEPSLTKKFMDQGKLPNIKKYVEQGACREDLVMLGAMPTITPPLWTTLATGAYPETHGITCFWRQSKESLDEIVYAFDSIGCKAEQLWNVFAEAGKKTMVWHWPGGSWPPSSNSENLIVVDGTQPASVSMGAALRDMEQYIHADSSISETIINKGESHDNGAGCIITDLEDMGGEEVVSAGKSSKALEALDKALNRKKVTSIMRTLEEGDFGTKLADTTTRVPLRDAKNWKSAKEGSKEFPITLAGGLKRWICLMEPNADGLFDTVAIYKKKQDEQPLVIIKNNELVKNIIDTVPYQDSTTRVNRSVRVFNLAPDGSSVELWVSNGMDIDHGDSLFHPKSFYKEIIENVDYVQPVMVTLGGRETVVREIMQPGWEVYTQWQADCIKYAIEEKGVEVVFSHLHNIDNMAHVFWNWAVERDYQPGLNVEAYEQFIENAYLDTDKYLGNFLPLLDEDWTIFIISDHGLLITEELPPVLGDPFGVNAGVMCELGYTVLKKDEAGNTLPEIDWTQTKAIATRGNHIWINLKGRNATGIVEPEDKYELERQIISDLYSYREPKNNHRIVALAMRNKDAAVIGMSGPECVDIIYFLEEGYNRVHGDSLSTYKGCKDTSVSPIYISAGKGLKKGCLTNRVIRQVDFAATLAHLGGVRMPAQCEGAPIYQILEDEM
jgi:predicted AlkP superfamily phosphohydrolase/phosphomutase